MIFLPIFFVFPTIGFTKEDAITACKISEFRCSNNDCIGLDKYCNGFSDCVDESDEFHGCTPCNRTYYGEIGKTYEIEIKRPEDKEIPFLCHLNFSAAGKAFGDLIQISFEAFSVGTFESFTAEGCPSGHVSIAEGGGRPPTGGKWCGSAWGYAVYYSETATANLTLRLEKLAQEQSAGYGFELRLAYRFLRAVDARLRYGSAARRTYRGKLHAGTYCDRVLEGCARRPCRVQSPNYPGAYPRNASCRYRIRERAAPDGRHALVAVRRSAAPSAPPPPSSEGTFASFDNGDRAFRVFERCNAMQDRLEILDGWDEDASPVLARLCSGEGVPEVVSSGPELLVRFSTSPFGNPFHPLPLSQLPGFELEVQVFYVKKESPTYVDGRKCEFVITTFENRTGFLENPLNSLPPNTTCHYYFHGLQNDIVWISFIKYHVSNERLTNFGNDCDVSLQIWDGDIKKNEKVPLMGQFCKEDKPKQCDHCLLNNTTRKTRPCDLSESYVSSGSDLTLTQSIKYGNVLHPVRFLLRYEFVDFSQEGTQNDLNPCESTFRKPNGRFYSPKITFLYGRGGRKSLKCFYHFESNEKRKLEIVFEKFNLKTKGCSTRFNKETNRYKCYPRNKEGKAQIRILEYPWKGVEILRDCFCENITSPVTIQTKTARKITIVFEVTKMNLNEDFNDYYFEATYNFLPLHEGCLNPWKTRRLKGSSGEITIRNSMNQTNFYCTQQPWLIEPENPLNNFLYLKIKGSELENATCATRNRISIYPVGNSEETKIICPVLNGSEGLVEVFSEGWGSMSYKGLKSKNSRSFVVEFLQNEPGDFAVTWMEISKNPALVLPRSLIKMNVPNCIHSCPELEACISPELWCDGLRHCPSGNDEKEINCSLHENLNFLAMIFVGFLLFLILMISISLACFWKRKRRGRENVIVSVTDHTFLEFKSGLC